MTLLKIDEPDSLASGKAGFARMPVWNLGFRPFYLLAAVFAALAIPLWISQYFGWVALFRRVDLAWHVHEMAFGFALLVIMGFLYTAAKNWTGLQTPRHAHLAALAGLWLAGRVAMLTAPAGLAAVIDFAFLPCAAWPIYQVLHKSGNKRNMVLIGLLALLSLCNALFHLALLGVLQISAIRPIQAAILIIVIIESVIGGRVIPGFTANTVPGSKPVTLPTFDKIMFGVVAAAGIAWLFALPAWIGTPLAFAAACLQLQRLSGWKSHLTLRFPLLWILHLAYAWIPFGFLLLGLSTWNSVPSSAAFHALTVGSMASLILGMMTRTSLGHTGRPLKAGGSELIMYILIQAGALSRFAASFDLFGSRELTLLIASFCWSGAFLLFVVVYAPYLLRTRLDGREG